MDLPLAVQHFFDIPDDIDLDNAILSDPSLTESSSSPPHLTASDDQLLSPDYWLSNAARYAQLRQRFLPYKLSTTSSNANWVDDLGLDDNCHDVSIPRFHNRTRIRARDSGFGTASVARFDNRIRVGRPCARRNTMPDYSTTSISRFDN
ncbi:hypothetical protein M404DRAFT_8012 [Pisolithus tinctorius Marx 270]|uniref:Uncharacterized protein n=1 Tax=Pisolithus tinctorius Marx 270 TaxID=870435 RepID=A0A0C3KHR6_PISTI|nr:hypothetical protein M404DRAFT_8012 [Pisolithus tinctorius Marx 270]